MGKTLGDYNLEKSSSSNIKNIKWTQKKTDTDKTKIIKKKKIKIPSTNTISHKKAKIKSSVKKIFKVTKSTNTKKLKNTKTDKRFQNSSASNCKIEQGFTRPAR